MARRALIAALAVGVATGATAGGTTYGAFTGRTDNPASTFTAAASFGARYVQTLGATSCGSSSSTVRVPAGGVPAGATVLVLVGTRNAAGFATATDSNGNAYTADVQTGGGAMRSTVLRTRLTAALAAGATITASYPAATASGMAAVQLDNVAAPPVNDGANGDQAIGTSPSMSVTTTRPRDLLVGAVSVEGPSPVTEASGWTMLGDIALDCGGASGTAGFHAGYRTAPSAATWSYAPTFPAGQYAGVLAAYRH